MSDHIIIATLKYIAIEIIWDIIYFPIWWYTKGLKKVANYCIQSAIFHINRRLALGIWLKSIFKPMYGDYTREGRIISFFMRLIVLLWKLVAVLLWLIVLFLLFIGWIILPLIIFYYIVYQTTDIPLIFFEN